METTIKTSFNFAKEIQCNFITKNNPEHSYPGTHNGVPTNPITYEHRRIIKPINTNPYRYYP